MDHTSTDDYCERYERVDTRVLQGFHNPEGFPPNDAILPRGSGSEVSALKAEILRGSPEVSAKNFGGAV